GALCNGELGGMFPRGGGEYVFLSEAYAPGVGFLSGWTSFWIGFPGSIAALAAGFGRAFGELAGTESRPVRLSVGLVAIGAFTGLNAFGLHAGRWAQYVLSGAKLAAIAALLVAGAFFAHGGAGHFTPFIAPESPTKLAGALIPIFFAYTGWNAATYVAGEIKNAHTDLGKALAAGTLVCALIYLALSMVYLRALSIPEMRGEPDLARAAVLRLFSPQAARLLTALVAVSVLSSLHAMVVTGARIYQAMAEDGLFFAPLGRLHATSRAPVLALVAQGIVSCGLLLSGDFEQILAFATFGMVLFATLTVAAVIVLRVRRPQIERPFKTPGYPWVPLAFVGGNVWVMWSVVAAGSREAIAGLAIIATGVPVFYAFRKWGKRAA
ncbi:MAG TPA: amino acid permease, partial [Polyangiaceae bacterium]